VDEKIWSAEWGRQIFFSHGSEHSRGVCVRIRLNSLLCAEKVELDPNGRYIILRLKIGENFLNVVNLYATTDYREQTDLIDLLSRKIVSLTDISNLIIAGDRGRPAVERNTLQELANLFHERDQSHRYLLHDPSQKQNRHLRVHSFQVKIMTRLFLNK